VNVDLDQPLAGADRAVQESGRRLFGVERDRLFGGEAMRGATPLVAWRAAPAQ
jgi:hypothetical protein